MTLFIYLSITDTLDPERRLDHDEWTVRCWVPCITMVLRILRVLENKARGTHLKYDANNINKISHRRFSILKSYIIFYLKKRRVLFSSSIKKWSSLHKTHVDLPNVSLNTVTCMHVMVLDVNHNVGSDKVTGCNSLFAINDDRSIADYDLIRAFSHLILGRRLVSCWQVFLNCQTRRFIYHLINSIFYLFNAIILLQSFDPTLFARNKRQIVQTGFFF